MPTPPGGERLSLRVLYVVALAFVVRLLYLTDHARSPLFRFPVLDALYYDTVARLLAQGQSLAEINPGFRPLLYPWLLSRLYLLSPDAAIPLALLGQHLLGVASTALVIWIAFRLGRSNPVAATAGLLFVLAGPPLYFEGELLLTALTTFLNLVLVAFLVAFLSPADDGGAATRRGRHWLLAGGLLGLAAQTRPNVLLFAAALPAGAFYLARLEDRSSAWRRALAPTALALAGLFLGLALFGALQRPAFGRFTLLTGAGGVNFYLGNKRQADGMIPRQDRAVTYADAYRDSVQVFAREELARARGVSTDEPTSFEISSFWLGRGLEEIKSAPLAWAGLMARKAWFLIWNHEIPNNRSYAWVAENESPLLRWLPVRWWLLVCLAPLGVVALWERGRKRALFWVVCFLLCWAAGLVLFFVNGRYRAPLWPLMCVLAAAGAVRLVDLARAAIRRRQVAAVLRALAASLALAALSLVNWLAIPELAEGRDWFYRSVANLEIGELEAARRDAEAAVAAAGTEAAYHFQLANVALAEDRPQEALDSLREAVRWNPAEPRIWNNLGVTHEKLGDARRAHAAYLAAIERVPDYAPALANAALLELRAGLLDAAAAHLAPTEGLRDPSIQLLCARAFLARATGRPREAETLMERARAIDAEIVDRLDEKSRMPVSLDPV